MISENPAAEEVPADETILARTEISVQQKGNLQGSLFQSKVLFLLEQEMLPKRQAQSIAGW
jgi:hypothetical protein